jgi:ferredoxin
MPWVITRLCRDCLDLSCVEVCPVDCIYEYTGEDRASFPNQLFIDPEECIDCGVCEPECPWEAIFEDERVPGIFAEDVGLNAAIVKQKQDFQVPEGVEKDKPTPEQVAGNKAKWGLTD